MKLSQWHEKDVKPVHIGVYQRDYSDKYEDNVIVYCFWDGEKWYTFGDDVEMALYKYQCKYDSDNSVPWRGIVKK